VANPQCEHGYTKIANELLEALVKYCANPSWLRISLMIIRLTYGWNRKEAEVNLKSIATKLTLKEEYIREIVIELEAAKIIKLHFTKPHMAVISLVKDWEKWTIAK
jgi:phage replication O-like protein O